MHFTVGSVPFTNARPLIHALTEQVSVELAVPSSLPQMLDSGHAQAVMVSSFDALSTPGRCFAEGCSISSLGAAESVRLFSTKPVKQIRSLALDSSSLTSNNLARVLLAERYGIAPEFVTAAPDQTAMLRRADACVLIGDKGMMAGAAGLEVIDLGVEWTEMTGLPFVWALWVGTRDSLTPELVGCLNGARAWGQAHLDKVIEDAQRRNGWPLELVRHYLEEIMNYDLTERHLEGLRLFRSLLKKHGLIAEIPFPEKVPVGAITVA